MFNQVMIIAQLKDTIEESLEAAETMDRAEATGCKPCKGVINKPRGWVQTEEEQSPCHLREDIKQVKELLPVHLGRQIRDVIQDMEEMRDICHQMSSFSLIQTLYSPTGWIVNDQWNGTRVQLKKMPHPKI